MRNGGRRMESDERRSDGGSTKGSKREKAREREREREREGRV